MQLSNLTDEETEAWDDEITWSRSQSKPQRKDLNPGPLTQESAFFLFAYNNTPINMSVKLLNLLDGTWDYVPGYSLTESPLVKDVWLSLSGVSLTAGI